MVLHNNAGSTVCSPKDVNVQFVPIFLDNTNMNYAVKLLYVNGGNDWEKNCTKRYGMTNCDLNCDLLSFVNDWMHHWFTLLYCLFWFDCVTYDLLFTFSKWILHSSFSVQHFNLLVILFENHFIKDKGKIQNRFYLLWVGLKRRKCCL